MYRVYYGKSLALTQMSAIRVVMAPDTSVVFDQVSDLSATEGQQVCFRLTATVHGVETSPTDGVCMILTAGDATLALGRFPCRPGLASEDLSGNCRASPPSMGALEAQG